MTLMAILLEIPAVKRKKPIGIRKSRSLQNSINSGMADMVKLKKLLSSMIDVTVYGSKEIEITGLSANSKTIAPGNLFVAKKGLKSDGTQFISESINAGASSILTDLYDPFLPSHITQLIASKGQISDVEAKLAATYYHFPSRELFLAGVTGTNGKTTTTYLIRHLLKIGRAH